MSRLNDRILLSFKACDHYLFGNSLDDRILTTNSTLLRLFAKIYEDCLRNQENFMAFSNLTLCIISPKCITHSTVRHLQGSDSSGPIFLMLVGPRLMRNIMKFAFYQIGTVDEILNRLTKWFLVLLFQIRYKTIEMEIIRKIVEILLLKLFSSSSNAGDSEK